MRPTWRSERPGRGHAGFTLVELVMVLAATGVLAAAVAGFVVPAVQAYFATAARAALAGEADTALRQISRELRRALPGSVRVSASGLALEFIPTTAGGRYATAGSGALAFGVADTAFDVLGPGLELQPGQQLVFHNLGPGAEGGDAYAPNATALQQATSNRRGHANAAGIASTVVLDSLAPLPVLAEAPPHRVLVVDAPVSYRCDLATGTLRRHSGYGWQQAQPDPPTGGAADLLASGVTACRFAVDGTLVAARSAIVSLALTLATVDAPGGAESVALHHAVAVDNLP
jgi:MSHA biogenesis protein MshO